MSTSDQKTMRDHRGRTKDGRGRVVKLLDPVPLYLLGRHDVIDAESLQRIAVEIDPSARRSRKWMFVLLFIVLPAVVLGIMASVYFEGRSAWNDLVSTLTNPAIFAAIIGGCVVPILVARQRRLRRVRRVMLRHRRCAHCGYDLRSLPTAPDGLTVCPECACAWNLRESQGESIEDAAGSGRWRAALFVLLGLGLVMAFAASLLVYFRVR